MRNAETESTGRSKEINQVKYIKAYKSSALLEKRGRGFFADVSETCFLMFCKVKCKLLLLRKLIFLSHFDDGYPDLCYNYRKKRYNRGKM